jgi:hypothetical protein
LYFAIQFERLALKQIMTAPIDLVSIALRDRSGHLGEYLGAEKAIARCVREKHFLEKVEFPRGKGADRLIVARMP